MCPNPVSRLSPSPHRTGERRLCRREGASENPFVSSEGARLDGSRVRAEVSARRSVADTGLRNVRAGTPGMALDGTRAVGAMRGYGVRQYPWGAMPTSARFPSTMRPMVYGPAYYRRPMYAPVYYRPSYTPPAYYRPPSRPYSVGPAGGPQGWTPPPRPRPGPVGIPPPFDAGPGSTPEQVARSRERFDIENHCNALLRMGNPFDSIKRNQDKRGFVVTIKGEGTPQVRIIVYDSEAPGFPVLPANGRLDPAPAPYTDRPGPQPAPEPALSPEFLRQQEAYRASVESQANYQLTSTTKTPDQIIADLSKNGVQLIFYPQGPSAGPRAGTFRAVTCVDDRGRPVPYLPPAYPPRTDDKPARLTPDILQDSKKCRDGLVAAAKGLPAGFGVAAGPATDSITLTFPGGAHTVFVRNYPSGISINRTAESGSQLFWLQNDSLFTFNVGATWLIDQAQFMAWKPVVAQVEAGLKVNPGGEVKVEERPWETVISVTKDLERRSYFFKHDKATGTYEMRYSTTPENSLNFSRETVSGATPPAADRILANIRTTPASPYKLPKPKTPEEIAAEQEADRKFDRDLYMGMMQRALAAEGITNCTVALGPGDSKLVLTYPGGTSEYEVRFQNSHADLGIVGAGGTLVYRRTADHSIDGITPAINEIGRHLRALKWMAQPAIIPGSLPAGTTARWDAPAGLVRLDVARPGLAPLPYTLRWQANERDRLSGTWYADFGDVRSEMAYGNSTLDIQRAADRIREKHRLPPGA